MELGEDMKNLFVNFSNWVGTNISLQSESELTTVEKNGSQPNPEVKEVDDLKLKLPNLNLNHKEEEPHFSSIQNTAKSFGNLIYNTVSEVGVKLVQTLEEHTILGELNKEQDIFLKSRNISIIEAIPPWVGFANEESLKEACLSLSNDTRNFIRSPPIGIDFEFNYETAYPIAIAIMKHDGNLEKMRFQLVPKIISERKFWKNYFYRLSLICKANEFSCNSFKTQSLPLSFESLSALSSKENAALCKCESEALKATSIDHVSISDNIQKLKLQLGSEEFLEKDIEVDLQELTELDKKSLSNNENDLGNRISSLLKNEDEMDKNKY